MSGGEGIAALGGGGARDVAGRGDERPAAAGPNSAVRLFGATGVAAAGGSAPGRQSATAHVQPPIAKDKFVLHVQHEFVQTQPRCEQSQRDCDLQPKVARNELPWVIVEQISQPQRGCGNSVFVRRAGDVGHNPVGVVIFCGRFPRVARASQPWALGRNPVGILNSIELLRFDAVRENELLVFETGGFEHLCLAVCLW